MGANILIVEDEEPLTTLLRYNLEAEGYEVDAVARGDDADTRLKETAPDLVVLDWMLPGLSGIELCRRLRARPQTQSLPIIMLTARGEEANACAVSPPGQTIISSNRFQYRNCWRGCARCCGAPARNASPSCSRS